MVSDFTECLLKFAKLELSYDSAIPIYRQFFKLRSVLEEKEFDDVLNMIATYADLIFRLDSFLELEKETLISLLELDFLIIKEIDLFKSLQRWINHQVVNANSSVNPIDQLNLFKSFKHLIKFRLLNAKEFNNKIPRSLLTDEELQNLEHFIANKTADYLIRNREAGKLTYDFKSDRYRMDRSVDEINNNYVVYCKDGRYRDDFLDGDNYNFMDSKDLDKNSKSDKDVNTSRENQEAIDFGKFDCIYIYKIRRIMGNENFEKGVSFSFDHYISKCHSENGFTYFNPPLRFRLNERHKMTMNNRRLRLESKLVLSQIHSNNKLDVILEFAFPSNAMGKSQKIAWDLYFKL